MGGFQTFQCDINEWINNGEEQINDDCYGWKSNIFPQLSSFEINVISVGKKLKTFPK